MKIFKLKQLFLGILIAFLGLVPACGGGGGGSSTDTALEGQVNVGGGLGPVVNSDGDFGTGGSDPFAVTDPNNFCANEFDVGLELGEIFVANPQGPVEGDGRTEETPLIIYTGEDGNPAPHQPHQTRIFFEYFSLFENTVGAAIPRIEFFFFDEFSGNGSEIFPFATFLNNPDGAAYLSSHSMDSDESIEGNPITTFIDSFGVWDAGASVDLFSYRTLVANVCEAKISTANSDGEITEHTVRSTNLYFEIRPETIIELDAPGPIIDR